MTTKIDVFIRAFSRFLGDSYEVATLPRGGDFEEWWCDWTQANWELLVEAASPWEERIRLEPYGDGAEAHSPSSRVTFPQDAATHRVICTSAGTKSLRNQLPGPGVLDVEELVFDRFVAVVGKWYREAPPFDMVLAYVGGAPVVVSVDSVRFALIEIDRDTGKNP